MGQFLGPKWSICPKQAFLEKSILFSSTDWHISLCKISKNPYNGPRVIMRMHHFWIQNEPIHPNRIFFKKLDKPSSYHSCLSTFQKSKSDINLLMKYCWLKNTEISLTKSHFWPSLENQIFLRHAAFAEF